MNFRTKPRGEQLSFITSCWKCAGDMTISNGRVDPHTCQPRKPLPLTVWADPEEVSGWQEIRKEILSRLDQACDNR